ncbi:MAG: potassium-transporting ATPase subunit F [Opitutaceae bacterium]|nr:potassium-transporting ATPase subunit F [Opitutaceae bacterium]
MQTALIILPALGIMAYLIAAVLWPEKF